MPANKEIEILAAKKSPHLRDDVYLTATKWRDLVFMVGQVSVDPVTCKLIEGDIEAHYRRACENMKLALEKTYQAVPAPKLVIASLLPDPVGSDRDAEEVTLRNDGEAAATMAGWTLKDDQGRIWALVSMGTIEPGASRTIRRNGMAMNLNTGGDHIRLINPENVMCDEFTYESCSAGVVIETGH